MNIRRRYEGRSIGEGPSLAPKRPAPKLNLLLIICPSQAFSKFLKFHFFTLWLKFIADWSNDKSQKDKISKYYSQRLQGSFDISKMALT